MKKEGKQAYINCSGMKSLHVHRQRGESCSTGDRVNEAVICLKTQKGGLAGHEERLRQQEWRSGGWRVRRSFTAATWKEDVTEQEGRDQSVASTLPDGGLRPSPPVFSSLSGPAFWDPA